ncbi:hypothetical protein LJB86_05605, partial [Deltaproteobacteria bacterium OttesenSCG-928-M10]|nr:hypothetical protein [Deltaproteobacteria bacterium OttesenSCG-928-M10]
RKKLKWGAEKAGAKRLKVTNRLQQRGRPRRQGEKEELSLLRLFSQIVSNEVVMLNLIKDYGAILCASVGVWIAWNGLSTWKKQLKSSTRYDMAHRMLYTVAASSPIIRTLNSGVNMICAMIDMGGTPEKLRDLLDVKEIDKLVAIQAQMELLKEEAQILFGEKSSQSYRKIYDFIAGYSGAIRIFPKILELTNLREEMNISPREFASKLVPLVTASEYMTMMSTGQMPEYHPEHAVLIEQVKKDIAPFLRHD